MAEIFEKIYVILFASCLKLTVYLISQLKYMKLSQKAITAIRTNTRTRLRVALALNVTEQWTYQLIIRNKENGPLTTATAVRVVMEETGLTEGEVLEEVLQGTK